VVAAQAFSVAHLGRTIENGGVEKRRDQCRSLARSTMQRPANDPNADRPDLNWLSQ
jgi:hypothetical protein